jgi:hypothetical protein
VVGMGGGEDVPLKAVVEGLDQVSGVNGWRGRWWLSCWYGRMD